MCSAFERSRFVMALAAALGAGVLASCDRGPTETAPSGEAPPIDVPVGPVPGPVVDAGARTNPFGDTDAVALNQGRTYFTRYNCAGCHGGHAGGGMGPSLRDGRWRYGKEDIQIFGSIAEGRGLGMPAWGTKLPDEQIWKLVAYIKSLRSDHEPEAPDQSAPEPPKDVVVAP
jgi:cytochrome c oxidase cbb3-type subunit 3